MVKFLSLAATAVLASTAVAQDVACVVNGVSLGNVDLATGTCPFAIPSNLPVNFQFTSLEDYLVDFYYAIADGQQFWTDIANAGRVIDIPAIDLYGQAAAQLFYVHREETPAVNSTAAIRKRLLGSSEITPVVKRDALSDFIASLKTIQGVAANIPTAFQVLNPEDVPGYVAPSSSANTTSTTPASSAPGGTATVTATHETVVTITSCSDHKCSLATVPATNGWTTTTVNGVETSYTTYCPETAATVTTSWVPATVSTVTVTKGAAVTTYTTYVAAPSTVTEYYTKGNSVVTTTKVVTPLAPTTVAPNTVGPATVAPATVAPAVVTSTAKPVAPVTVSTANGANAASVGSILALVVVPLAYFL